jgi:hypothetical protein
MQILVLAGLYKETIPGWRQSSCLNDMFLAVLFSLKPILMSCNYDMRERYHDRIIVWLRTLIKILYFSSTGGGSSKAGGVWPRRFAASVLSRSTASCGT